MSGRRRKRQYVILPASGAVSGSSDPEPKAPLPKSRHDLIAEAAYARAVRRGFRDGDPISDWLAAEAEIDAMAARRNED